MWKEPLKADELDGHGDLFGWKFSDGGSNGLVTIYIEDDENWHEKMTFDVFWLADFKRMADLLWPNA
jgi:hypothetical protein